MSESFFRNATLFYFNYYYPKYCYDKTANSWNTKKRILCKVSMAPFRCHSLWLWPWIFTLVNDLPKINLFWPVRFTHQWNIMIHVTLQVSDVTDKWKNWLANVMFDWHHVMETAVQRNNQTHWFITFLCRLFTRSTVELYK